MEKKSPKIDIKNDVLHRSTRPLRWQPLRRQGCLRYGLALLLWLSQLDVEYDEGAGVEKRVRWAKLGGSVRVPDQETPDVRHHHTGQGGGGVQQGGNEDLLHL